MDNGLRSTVQMPQGETRPYASPRKYLLDVEAQTATEVWNFEMDQSLNSPICSSVYEDAPFNYLIDYSDVNGPLAVDQFAQLLGLTPAGEVVFHYQYETNRCNQAFNAIPLHLEKSSFPTVQPRALNISTRGTVGTDENSLIGGFIVSGTEPKTVVIRALGPSLGNSGVTNPVADPVLSLIDDTGALIASNDDWQSDAGAAQITAAGLAPAATPEAATIQTLGPGADTFVVTGKDATVGIGLIEAYDLSALADSKLANISTRGFIDTGEGVLISGFIIGDVDSATVVVRAIGPSLGAFGISTPLADPMLTVFDSNGVALATNDSWAEDGASLEIEQNGLAPTDAAEAATILNLIPGSYTTLVSGVDDGTGVGLVETYNLP